MNIYIYNYIAKTLVSAFKKLYKVTIPLNFLIDIFLMFEIFPTNIFNIKIN
jgi:hypothetical protein